MNQSGRRAVDLYREKPNKMQAYLQNRECKYDKKIKELLQGKVDVGYFKNGKDDKKEDECNQREDT
jgi:hypothetical protein